MAAVKGPAVIPEAGDGVRQITRMDHELIDRFVDPVLAFADDAGAGEEQTGHEQRVVP
ncbi:hypothetical protein D3C87_1518200 [compost metagenome]